MHRRNIALASLAGLMALMAGGCTSNLGTSIPTWAGGEPADVPPPKSQAGTYPLIGAVPPPRPTKPVTEDEQKRMESELSALRKRVDTESKSAEKTDQAQKSH